MITSVQNVQVCDARMLDSSRTVQFNKKARVIPRLLNYDLNTSMDQEFSFTDLGIALLFTINPVVL